MNLAALIPRLIYLTVLIYAMLMLGFINEDRRLHITGLDFIAQYSRSVTLSEAFGWGLLACLSLAFMIIDAAKLSKLEAGGRATRKRKWLRLFRR